MAIAIRNQVNENLRVARSHDAIKSHAALVHYRIVRRLTFGDANRRLLWNTLHCVKDQILLEYFVLFKGVESRFKNVKMNEIDVPQQVFAERTEVRTVAKTSRCNCDEFATPIQEQHNKSQKRSIEIARFNIQTAEKFSDSRFSTELLVRWIQNRDIETLMVGLEEPSIQECNRRFDKIRPSNLPSEGNIRGRTAILASHQGSAQIKQYAVIEFIGY